ncbi:MAG: ABC transporter ATP-binding protein [Ardenticatenaceae bacterium]|nr:ABC transporter ATP-binding protein [Ardenticatenaceae bacterium]
MTTQTSTWRKRREERMRDMLPDEENQIGKYDSGLLLRLFDYVKPYRRRLILSIVFITISSLLGVAGPYLIGRAVDDGIRVQNIEQLRFWTVLFIIASILEWITNRYRIQIMAYVGTGVVADLRSALFRHLHRLSLNFHNNYSVGRMMSRLLGDITVLRDFITWSITGLFRSMFGLVGIIVAMLAMNWRLALVSFVVLPIMAIITNYWRVYIRVAYRAARARSSIISGYFNESISGIRVTKSFTREDENFEYFKFLNRSYREANVRAARLTALFFPSVDFVGSLSAALVVVYGGSLVLDERLSAGILIAFVLYVQRFFQPIRELAMRYNTFQASMASCERIFSLIDLQPDLIDDPAAAKLPPILGRVQFEAVNFAYKPDEPVLQGVSIEADPGQQIALVGETGAGKSTIIRLLARFFDVSDGQILIDGHDIRDVSQTSLREQLGVVLQDTFLFSGSIMDNIRYGRLNASDQEVINAAQAVGADEFISKLPEGYFTDVGQNGVNLSVGQRQILSFARALLADPRILVLDEATSSVDTASERQIQAALEKLLKGRTSFVIAHRLNTIVKSDKIVVLDHGRVVEEGTHEDLLEQKGRYFNLYTMQWAAQEEDQSQFSLN